MTVPRHVAHVFPYDTRHLGIGIQAWAAGQLERWPLAAVARSDLAERSTVHVIGPRAAVLDRLPLKIMVHRSVTSGPLWREWGDDWSSALARALGRLGPDDVAVVHLNDYPAARLAQRAARDTRTVLVFHGRGTGKYDEHVGCATRLVVLREEAARELVGNGAAPDAPVVFRPTIDSGKFFPPDLGAEREPTLGFVGRLEPAKGSLELAAVVGQLNARRLSARVEVVGSARPGDASALGESVKASGAQDRLLFVGERSPAEIAERMRRWKLLLLPSYSEGFSLVVLEALACGLPVAAVSGVLPQMLEAESLVRTAPRERYPELVADLVSSPPTGDPPSWVADHQQGGGAWDELLTNLPPFRPCGPIPVDQWARFKRLRPLRRAVRFLRQRPTDRPRHTRGQLTPR